MLFGSHSSVTVTITDIPEGRRVYLLKANQSDNSVVAGNTGYAETLSAAVPREISESRTQAVPLEDNKRIERRGHREAEEFNAQPLLPQSRSAAEPPSIRSVTGYGYDSPYIVNQSKKDFWVEDKQGGWIEISATLRALGKYCYIWVADDNFDNSSTAQNDNRITGLQAEALKDRFDGSPEND